MEHEIDIAALRRDLSLTQVMLAELIGVDQGTVSAWENGKHKPTSAARKALMRLAAGARRRRPSPIEGAIA